MIGYLKGKVAMIDPAKVVLDVHGVGYEVFISLHTFGMIKGSDEIKLHTYLHVKEDAHVLYGFGTPDEKDIFLQLISISGIGPGTALMITSSMTVSEIRKAIAREDVQAIKQVKGIGLKTAQRVILELRDKVMKGDFDDQTITDGYPAGGNARNEALSALITLGIHKSVAEKSIDDVLKNTAENIPLEELIRQALKRA